MLLNYIKRSQLYFIGSFVGLILGGAALLKLPVVQYRPGGVLTHITWIDALFTSTSAVCVTGLTVLDTGSLNWLGQGIILTLIQLGGLGIMTLSASIILFLGRGISVNNTMMLANLNENFSIRHTESLIKMIALFTFTIESIGAVLLWLSFWLSGVENWYTSLYMGIFHSISAFCNAGFSPYANSLCDLPAIIKVIIAALIVVGGLGWYVYYDLSHFRDNNRELRLHSKVVLLMTVLLITGGMFGILHFEASAGRDISWIDAGFQSVTARTAGFNSVPLVDQVAPDGQIDEIGLTPNSLTLITILMLIGAAPGSTGGGIKVVAVALAAMAIINTFKGNRTVLIFKREIPISNVLKAFTILCTFLVLSTIGAVMLSNRALEDIETRHAYFESVSALSTVGLSAGLTAVATTANKMVLILLMFIGRIGPFTMLLFLLGREKESRLQYPEERMIIG